MAAMTTTDLDTLLWFFASFLYRTAIEISDEVSGIAFFEAHESSAPGAGLIQISAGFERSSAAVGMHDTCGAAIIGRLGLLEVLNREKCRAIPDFANNLTVHVVEHV